MPRRMYDRGGTGMSEVLMKISGRDASTMGPELSVNKSLPPLAPVGVGRRGVGNGEGSRKEGCEQKGDGRRAKRAGAGESMGKVREKGGQKERREEARK